MDLKAVLLSGLLYLSSSFATSVDFCPAACALDRCSTVSEEAAAERSILISNNTNAYSRGSDICLSPCRRRDGSACFPSLQAANDMLVTANNTDQNATVISCSTSPCNLTISGCVRNEEYFKPSCAECLAIYPEACSHLAAGQNQESVQTIRSFSPRDTGKQPHARNARVLPADIVARWNALSDADGQCSQDCMAAKSAMCQMMPSTCVQMRCEDERRGVPTGLLYGPLCSIVERWDESAEANGVCGPECQQQKLEICYTHVRMCPSLRCKDISNGEGDQRLSELCADQLLVEEALYLFSGESPNKDMLTSFLRPLPPQDIAAAENLREYSMSGVECGDRCRKVSKDLCTDNPVLCMQLRCEEAWNSIGDAGILEACDAFYPFAITPNATAAMSALEEADTRLEILREWQALHTDGPCGDDCRASKEAICARNHGLCLHLRCNETNVPGHGIQALKAVCEDSQLGALLPALSEEQVEESRLTALEWYKRVIQPAALNNKCGPECREIKLHTCMSAQTNRLCVVLTCLTAKRLGMYNEDLDSVCPTFLEEFKDILAVIPAEVSVAGATMEQEGQEDGNLPSRPTCAGEPFKSFTSSQLQRAGAGPGIWQGSVCSYLCKIHDSCVASVFNPDEYFRCRMYDTCETKVWIRPKDILTEASEVVQGDSVSAENGASTSAGPGSRRTVYFSDTRDQNEPLFSEAEEVLPDTDPINASSMSVRFNIQKQPSSGTFRIEHSVIDDEGFTKIKKSYEIPNATQIMEAEIGALVEAVPEVVQSLIEPSETVESEGPNKPTCVGEPLMVLKRQNLHTVGRLWPRYTCKSLCRKHAGCTASVFNRELEGVCALYEQCDRLVYLRPGDMLDFIDRDKEALNVKQAVKDLLQGQPDSVQDTIKSLATIWTKSEKRLIWAWQGLGGNGCGTWCQRRKRKMCERNPSLCLVLRCQDAKNGKDIPEAFSEETNNALIENCDSGTSTR